VVCALVSLAALYTVYVHNDESNNTNGSSSSPRPNIIFMISDGFSPSSETFARTFATANKNISDQELLPLDGMLVGVSRTYSSMSLVTDSAAGATAYACGKKSYNGAIAVDDNMKPMGTAMEAAKALGWTTGIVTTSRITHATPASFSSHTSDREYEEDIAEQQATEQYVDILFGGGLQKFTDREDDQDLFTVMNGRNYTTIQTLAEFEEELSMPVIGLFAPQHLAYEVDRVQQNPPTQPSLTQMVTKTLQMLKDNENPFFLLIEGARIDMAAHNHDAYAHYLEIMEYQRTVEIVKDFVDKNPNTYVVSVADHATGGISTGQSLLNGSYPDPYMWYPQNLLGQTMSTELMAEQIGQDGMDTLNATVLEYAGIVLTDKEFEYITDMVGMSDNTQRELRTSIGTVISHRALVGWTTPGHTGVDVNLYAYGKRPSTMQGVKENIDVGNDLWNEIGLVDTMQEITTRLQNMTIPPPQNDPHTQAGKGMYIVCHD